MLEFYIFFSQSTDFFALMIRWFRLEHFTQTAKPIRGQRKAS